MKKLMKALAFATVACMLLSTAAFAAGDAVAEMDETGAANVTVNVTGATASTPISIVVTASDVESAEAITSGNILYINQDVTDASGNVTFPAVDTKGEKTVAVFLGYEGVGNEALRRVAEEVKLEPGDNVEIVFTKLYQPEDVEAFEGAAATDNDYGAGAVVDVNFAIDSDRTIADMFWSISYKDGDVDEEGNPVVKKAYVKADSEVLKCLSGEVRLGITASAGSKIDEEKIELTAVNVIVKTTNAEASKVLTIYSDKTGADEKNNTNYVEVPAE